MSKILDSAANTSNAFKYLELGIYPVRFEIMKRKLLYLQYLLQQEKTSMIHQVLKATIDNPIKNDFVQTCQKYLDYLNIDLTFEQIAKMSKWKMKKLVNEKVSKAGFRYLLEKTTKQIILFVHCWALW